MEKTLCYKCFHEYEGSGPCPVCGYDGAGQEKYSFALRPGTILDGRYIVGRVLGQGGFGITYIAQDYNSKKLVAIKEHFPSAIVTRMPDGSVSLISDSMRPGFEAGKESFLSEAKVLSEFNGLPNICNIYSYFEEKGTAYFAMEYVDGTALNDYLKKLDRMLGLEEVFDLLRPVMDAMSRVHEKGLIHRDIAPDNIIIRTDGSPVLIDFGAARYSMSEKSQSMTVVIKHGFAPLEQYARRGRRGPYTDVYAMAATIYYCISGKLPPDAVDRSSKDELVSLSQLGMKVSPWAEQVMNKALALDYKQRYQSMGDFVNELEAAINSKAPVKKGGKGKLIGIIAVAAAAVAVAVIALGGDKTEPAPVVTPAPQIEEVEASPEPTIKPILWEQTDEHTITLMGDGDMEAVYDSAPWATDENRAAVKKLIIGEGITSISPSAFEAFEALKDVYLPESLEKVGESAFAGCSALQGAYLEGSEEQREKLSIAAGNEDFAAKLAVLSVIAGGETPDGFIWELISDGTLYINGSGVMADYEPNIPAPWANSKNARLVRHLVLGEGITSTGDYAFRRCENLEDVVFPEGITAIGRGSFSTCEKLNDVVLPQTVDSINVGAFNNCYSLDNIVLSDAVENLYDGTFHACPLKSIVLPANLKQLSGFSGCTMLESIILPEGLAKVGDSAFAGCTALSEVVIYGGVSEISGSAFQGCHALSSVVYMGSQEQWGEVTGYESFAETIMIFN